MDGVIMLILIPHELKGKIDFKNNDVIIRKGEKLTDEEKKIFDSFREEFKRGYKMRFED